MTKKLIVLPEPASSASLLRRLRISLSAAHSEADVDLLIRELRACGLPTAVDSAQPSPAVVTPSSSPQQTDSAADTGRRPDGHPVTLQARL